MIRVFLARKRVAIEIFRDLLANTYVQRTSFVPVSGSFVFFEEFLARKRVGDGCMKQKVRVRIQRVRIEDYDTKIFFNNFLK